MFILYGRQNISQQDIDAVVEVLKSDWLTQGPAVSAFENAVMGHCGANYAVAVCNATAALHIACKALGVGSGDRVWTSPNSFVASANCALYCGASVDFVDICPVTYNLSIDRLTEKLQAAKKAGQLPKVVIPVHFAGQSCDMREISKLADQYGFKVIEDASHAVGAKYIDKPVGSCEYSDISIFSFHPVKIITTGEGGVCLTNDKKIADKLSLYRTHGVTRDVDKLTKKNEGPWYYEQIDLGYNYRITDIQCALGCSQLKRLDDFVQKRNELAAIYNERLVSLPLKLPQVNPDNLSAFHLYPIQVLSEKSRRAVFETLREKQIGVNVHYIPIHLQPYYRKLGFKVGDFPVAEAYYERAISLPLFPDLTEKQQSRVIDALAEVLK